METDAAPAHMAPHTLQDESVQLTTGVARRTPGTAGRRGHGFRNWRVPLASLAVGAMLMGGCSGASHGFVVVASGEAQA